MCLAIPSIIVSDFYANRSRFIVNMWFESFSLPLQVFRPYSVVFFTVADKGHLCCMEMRLCCIEMVCAAQKCDCAAQKCDCAA